MEKFEIFFKGFPSNTDGPDKIDSRLKSLNENLHQVCLIFK